MHSFWGTAAAIGIPFAAFLIQTHPALAEPGAKKTLTVQTTGCNCGRGRTVSAGPPAAYSTPTYSDPHAGYGPTPNSYGEPFDDYSGGSPGVPPAPFPEDGAAGPLNHGPYAQGPVGQGPAPQPGPLGSSVNPHTDGPPPGTIGTTYRRSSRKIPSEKHPRTAMLDVSVENAYDVWVDGFKSYRTKDGVWHLESKEPLVPGVPHVYNVRARMGEEDDSPFEYRTVRLIPGRIIDLQW